MVDYSGYTRSKVIGKNLIELLHPEDLELNQKLLAKLKSTEVGLCQCQRRLVRKDGSPLLVETVSSSILVDAQGRIREILSVDVDIAERILMEKERIKREKLQSTIETAGAVCHELNQPLQVLLGRVELMLMDNVEESKRLHLKCIEQEVNRMVEMTIKLQKITKYETQAYLKKTRIMDIDQSTS